MAPRGSSRSKKSAPAKGVSKSQRGHAAKPSQHSPLLDLPIRAALPHRPEPLELFPTDLTDGRCCLLDAAGLQKALVELADQIQNDFPRPAGLMLLGIRTRGIPLAERLKAILDTRYDTPVAMGSIDITLYRDDLAALGPQPIVREAEFPFDIHESCVILVDDVLYTGRTVRAALDEIVDFGRPRVVRLAVLVDRGWREYPIQADYVATRCPTTQDQIIHVGLRECGEEDEVILRVRDSG